MYLLEVDLKGYKAVYVICPYKKKVNSYIDNNMISTTEPRQSNTDFYKTMNADDKILKFLMELSFSTQGFCYNDEPSFFIFLL